MKEIWIEVIAWTSQLLFMFSAAPQAYKAYKQGHSDGISPGMLWLWFIGESLAIIYGILSHVPLPIFTNYIVNAIFMLVIIRYYYFRRTK